MPGLQLGIGAQARTTALGGTPPPTTATQAAFGPAATPAVGSSALAPNDVGGLAFWVGVGGVVFLLAVYYSLPG